MCNSRMPILLTSLAPSDGLTVFYKDGSRPAGGTMAVASVTTHDKFDSSKLRTQTGEKTTTGMDVHSSQQVQTKFGKSTICM